MTTSAVPVSLLDSARIPVERCSSQPTEARRLKADTVVRAQSGDPDALSELYLQHRRRVFGLCMRMVHDFALAEDLTQEIFLQVHRKIASFRGDSAFTTWLHRMSVNSVLMYLRKRALPVVSLDGLMEDTPQEHTGRSFGARDLLQAGVVDRLDIDRAVAAMAPGYRNIFMLHDIHGFDHEEIATMLKCTRGNTKSQLHKARRLLRKALTTQSRSTGTSADLFLVPSKRRAPNKSTRPRAASPSRG